MAKTAGRMQPVDHLGRPNADWARCHERLNELLDKLGSA